MNDNNHPHKETYERIFGGNAFGAMRERRSLLSALADNQTQVYLAGMVTAFALIILIEFIATLSASASAQRLPASIPGHAELAIDASLSAGALLLSAARTTDQKVIQHRRFGDSVDLAIIDALNVPANRHTHCVQGIERQIDEYARLTLPFRLADLLVSRRCQNDGLACGDTPLNEPRRHCESSTHSQDDGRAQGTGCFQSLHI